MAPLGVEDFAARLLAAAGGFAWAWAGTPKVVPSANAARAASELTPHPPDTEKPRARAKRFDPAACARLAKRNFISTIIELPIGCDSSLVAAP